jgi:hypothetical protein
LYDANTDRRLADNDDASQSDGENLDSRIDLRVSAGRHYIAKVRRYGSNSGNYSFRANLLLLPDANLEPNDSRAAAARITLGQDVPAYFSDSSDQDWYQVEVPAAGVLAINTTGSVDTLLELYNAQGNRLASDDDSGDGNNARIRQSINAAGTVFIKASAYSGSGNYVLQTRMQAPLGRDAFEPDDTSAQAKAIELRTPQRHTFTNSSDVDWVTFRVAQAGYYIITARGEETTSLDTVLRLYNEQQTLITEDDDGGNGRDSRIRVRLFPGTYFVRVHCLDSSVQEGYNLTVQTE